MTDQITDQITEAAPVRPDLADLRFWKSAGLHLLDINADNQLVPTADFIRAYLTRPEVHPVPESGPREIALHESLLADPFRAVDREALVAIEDPDAIEAYQIVLGFRDRLISAGTLEQAYGSFFAQPITLPPVFLDQMLHIILAHILRDARDPFQPRAAELFFRSQNVNLDEGRVMLADEEIVETYADTGGMGGLGQLLVEANTPMRQVSLDVLDEDNKADYWARSDRFDTVIDFRFTQPALDAFARVLEIWLRHMRGISARIRPVQSIKDEKWSWHIGLDAQATAILNALYEGEEVGLDDLQRVIALFTMEIEDRSRVKESMRGKPVYLALAADKAGKLRMKPQNLLLNLPLVETV